jgi:twitching motility protein PilT
VAQLDRFIQAIQQHKAQGLVLAPGKQASLLFEAGPRGITKDSLSAAQILPLVREIAPAAEQARMDGGVSALTFEYHGPGGVVAVEVTPEADGRRVVIRPAPARPAGAPSAPPFPPQHPQPPASEAPAPKAASAARIHLEQLLRLTAETGASDLHLRTGEPAILRRDGELIRQEGQVLDAESLDAIVTSTMPARSLQAFRETGDTDWAHELPGGVRFRCNAAQERRGPMGSFRVIPSRIMTADELGLSPEVQRLSLLSKGLVLVTGPTGSGKSTTLAALVDLINGSRTDHILTIEDPIEFVHQGKKCVVTQRQVGEHTRSFKAALRAALREDPDIVMVGEMRDLETVSIAIETAETGHLVFGTLHTTTAASTIDRVIDQFPADRQSQVRVMLSESLKGVIAQVLCRKIGGGRVAAKEVLLATPAVSNLIREGKTFQIPSIIQTSRKVGMVLLNDALMELVEQKLVEPREAYLKATEKIGFAAALKAKRFDTAFLSES